MNNKIYQELYDLFAGRKNSSDKTAIFNISNNIFNDIIDYNIVLKTFFINEEINNNSVLDLNLDINNINKTFFINEEINNNSVLDLNLDINNINKTFFINEEI